MSSLRRVSLALVLLLATACGSGPDIRGEDRDALLASARVYVDVGIPANDPERSQPIGGLELEVAGVQGNFENAGSGRADYDLLASHVGWRFGTQLRYVELFGYAGIAGLHFDGRTTRGARTDDEYLGATAGFQLGWRPTAWMVPYGRVSLAQYQDFASSLRAEGGIEFRPSAAIGLQVGYAYWEFERDADKIAEPDIDVTTQGIFAGVTLRF